MQMYLACAKNSYVDKINENERESACIQYILLNEEK